MYSHQSKCRSIVLILVFALSFSNIAFGNALKSTEEKHWASTACQEGLERGWIGSVERDLAPEACMTRQQFSALMKRVFIQKSETLQPPIDVSGYAEFTDQKITRMEAAFKLHLLLNAHVPERVFRPFADMAALPVWAVDSVKAMTEAGIFSGYPDGTFRGNQALTEGEALSLMLKAFPKWNAISETADNARNGSVISVSENSMDTAYRSDTHKHHDKESAEPEDSSDEVPATEPEPDPEGPSTPETGEAPSSEVDSEVNTAFDGELRIEAPAGGLFFVGDAIQVSVLDNDLNQDPEVVESVEIEVVSFENFETLYLILQEENENSACFWGTLTTGDATLETQITVSPYTLTMLQFTYIETENSAGEKNIEHGCLIDITPVTETSSADGDGGIW